jgi:hypothetical protein
MGGKLPCSVLAGATMISNLNFRSLDRVREVHNLLFTDGDVMAAWRTLAYRGRTRLSGGDSSLQHFPLHPSVAAEWLDD